MSYFSFGGSIPSGRLDTNTLAPLWWNHKASLGEFIQQNEKKTFHTGNK